VAGRKLAYLNVLSPIYSPSCQLKAHTFKQSIKIKKAKTQAKPILHFLSLMGALVSTNLTYLIRIISIFWKKYNYILGEVMCVTLIHI
jgi:hypothetical protein